MNRVWLVFMALAIVACKGETPVHEKGVFRAESKQPPPSPLQSAVAAHAQCVNGTVINVPFYAQPPDIPWCWAASGQMVIEAFGNKGDQCVLVNEICKREKLACQTADCCLKPESCKITGWPPLELHGLRADEHPGALMPEDVVIEMRCFHRPFLFTWNEGGGGGHMQVAIDFVTDDLGKDWMIVHDPAFGKASPIPWERYVNGFSSHGKDLIHIERVGS